LGAKNELEVDVRIVAATNRQLEDGIRAGTFREDLYYRLNVFRLELPPLRDRLDDLPLLAEALLAQMNGKHNLKVTGLDEHALLALRRRAWPGNIRELRNVLERASILAGEGLIRPVHLGPASGLASPPPTQLDPESILLRVGTTVEEAEKQLILKTLEHTNNNKTRAAEILSVSLKTLHNKLKLYGGDTSGD
jgi:DNA-binding NtrC family response regulator